MVPQWDSLCYLLSTSSDTQSTGTKNSIEYDAYESLTLEQLIDKYNDDNSINATSVVNDTNVDQSGTSPSTDKVTQASTYHKEMNLPFLSD